MDDKDQNSVIIFKLQSLQIILGALQKWLKSQYCAEKQTAHAKK